MSETVTASDGTQLPVSELPKAFVFVGGLISTITVNYDGNTSNSYRKTFTFSGGYVSSISRWEPL